MRKVILGLILLGIWSAARNPVYGQAATMSGDAVAATQAGTGKSEMVVVAGLGVVVQAVKKESTPEEPLVLKLTYTNMGKDVLRLADVPGNMGQWRLMLEEVKSGKKYTGQARGTRLPSTVASIRPTVLKPGESVIGKTQLQRFGFLEGDLDAAQFKEALAAYVPPEAESGGATGRVIAGSGGAPMGLSENSPVLPEGIYKVRVEIRLTGNAEAAPPIKEKAKQEGEQEGETVPTWNGELIVSQPVIVEISKHALPAEVTTEDRENARQTVDMITGWMAKDADFLQQHGAIVTIWNRVQRAANAVLDDDGKDPAGGAGRLNSFGATLRQAAAQSRIVAGRRTETQEAKDKALQIAEKFEEMANR